MEAILVFVFALTMLAGCAIEPRQTRTMVKVQENIALDGIEEVSGRYSRSDGFWSTSYVFVADGTFKRQFIPDDLGQIRDSDTVRGKWRLADSRSVETEWKGPNGILQRQRLQFVAIDGRLGFIADSRRQALESEGVDWRQRTYIFQKEEPIQKSATR